MGLDIYVFRPYKPEDPASPELKETWGYSDEEEVRKHFPDMVVNRDIVTDMWGDYWKSRGLNPDDWETAGWWSNSHQFRHKKTNEKLAVPGADVPKAIVKTDVVYYKEVGYQRKGMDSGFYDNLQETATYSRSSCFSRYQFIEDTSYTNDKESTAEMVGAFEDGKCFAIYSW